jgi:hypothetical protein
MRAAPSRLLSPKRAQRIDAAKYVLETGRKILYTNSNGRFECSQQGRSQDDAGVHRAAMRGRLGPQPVAGRVRRVGECAESEWQALLFVWEAYFTFGGQDHVQTARTSGNGPFRRLRTKRQEQRPVKPPGTFPRYSVSFQATH